MTTTPKKIWRVIELLQWGEGYFSGKGIEQPRLEMDYLVAHVLGKKRLEIYLQFDAVVTPKDLQNLKLLIERRVSGEPLQYILGETDFLGCRILVNFQVLIPRSETEHMVDEAVRVTRLKNYKRALDLGTGSGAIAIALAKSCPGLRIQAVDFSSSALKIARGNAELNGVLESIEFVENDMLHFLSQGGRADLLVSNPPYIPLAEYDKLAVSVKKYEPRQALTDEKNGKFFLEGILRSLPDVLSEEGTAFLEFGYGFEGWILDFVRSMGFKGELFFDLQQHGRFIKITRN